MSVKRSLANAGRRVGDPVWQATRSHRMLPSFLIVGAQRAGTTSMFRALEQHPDVVPPMLRKGVHYFDLAFDRPLDWYQGHFPLRRPSRGTPGSRSGHERITGESSPYYLWHPLAPSRIASTLPGVRVLVLVRDPVERAYSAHSHEYARGFESEPFERAIELEESRLEGLEEKVVQGGTSMVHQHQAYLGRSHYAPQLERLAEAVGREHVHVVDSGCFFERPQAVFDGVCSFLGLAPCTTITFEQHNARSRAPLDPVLRAELEDRFVESDEALTGWLGGPPSWRG